MSNFWDFMWLLLTSFVLVAYLIVLFHVIFDLFRDSELGGFSKFLWVVFLIFLPFLTAFAYVLFRGKGMAERQRAAVQKARSETDAYIREVAGKSPAEQIGDAKALLDKGAITQAEFERLKAKALA